MPRAVDGSRRKDRRKKLLSRAKGYWGTRSKLHRVAKTQLMKSGKYAFRDRRAKKREFRRLWIARLSAACREQGINYSRFINGLAKSGITLNRKTLSNMAIEDNKAFIAVVEQVKKSL
jgi:large subunit ribosomal protein L20